MTQPTQTTQAEPSVTPLAALLARAAEESAARLIADKASAEKQAIEKARAHVAEAIALWGFTPYPSAIAPYLQTLASSQDFKEITTAEMQCLVELGVPAKVQKYIAGEHHSCLGPHWDGIAPHAHPATRATYEERQRAAAAERERELAAKRAAWLAMPEEEHLTPGFNVATSYGIMTSNEAERLSVVDEYARRLARGEALKAAAQAKREAIEAAKPALLTAIVQAFGDADAIAARAEDKLLGSEIVDMLWKKLFDDRDVRPRWLHDAPGYDIYHRDEKIEDVERVSVAAYRALRALRDLVEATVKESAIAALGTITVAWQLERVSYNDADAHSCHAVLCSITLAETITLSARHVLAEIRD